jgi:hypothetical protein
MRYSTPTVTLGLYVQAITQDKRNAQEKNHETVQASSFSLIWTFPNLDLDPE